MLTTQIGDLVRQTDTNGHVTRYEYDRLSRRTAAVLPLGQRSETTYDAVGNITAIKDFNGDTIAFDYDARNRLTSKNFPDGTAVTYAFTPTSRLNSTTDSRGVTHYAYDLRDRLLTRTDPDGTHVSYAYDAAGNRTSVTATVGGASLTTSYTFDMLNRLETVTDPDQGVTRYTYDATGNLTRTELPNNTVETRSYDDLNHLLFLENRGPSGVISSHRYTLAATGRRDAMVEHDGRRVDYTYDTLDRLTREKITDAVFGDRTIDYTYDTVGNRLTRSDSAEGLTQYTYDANDRLLTELASAALTEYTYDGNGNMLSRDSATDRVIYDWDFENRLISADTDGDGTIDVRNQYDANGNRVSQTAGGEETRFLVDTVHRFPQVVVEYRPSGLIVASYVYGRRIISQSRDGDRSFYHVDALGSTRALTSATVAVLNRAVYEAFGQIIRQSGSTPNSYLFAGQQRDAALGLDFLRARYYDPALGRFTAADPLRGSIAEPIYAYALNNPVNRTDPSGLFSLTEFAVALVTNTIKFALYGALLGAIDGAIRGGLDGALAGALKGLKMGALFGGGLGLVRGGYAAVGFADRGIRASEFATRTFAVVTTAAGVHEAITPNSERDRAAAIFGLLTLGILYRFERSASYRSKEYTGSSDGQLMLPEIAQYTAETRGVNIKAAGETIEVNGVGKNGQPATSSLVDVSDVPYMTGWRTAQRAPGDTVQVILPKRLVQREKSGPDCYVKHPASDLDTTNYFIDSFVTEVVGYGNNSAKTFFFYFENSLLPVRVHRGGQSTPKLPPLSNVHEVPPLHELGLADTGQCHVDPFGKTLPPPLPPPPEPLADPKAVTGAGD